MNHHSIGTKHILLGLIGEGDGAAARALASFGVSLEAARQQVSSITEPGSVPQPASPPFTPRAKKVLELALRESLAADDTEIGTRHLLLGLVREGRGVGAQVLVKLGVGLAQVRPSVLHVEDPPGPRQGAAAASGASAPGPDPADLAARLSQAELQIAAMEERNRELLRRVQLLLGLIPRGDWPDWAQEEFG